jgi:hypothetical protein
MLQYQSTLLNAFGSKGNISSNDDISLPRTNSDPYVCHVRPIGNNNIFNQWVLRRPQATITDDVHFDFVPGCDTLGLYFHRASVCIDIKRGQCICILSKLFM